MHQNGSRKESPARFRSIPKACPKFGRFPASEKLLEVAGSGEKAELTNELS
jgi:hypothetical protein